MSQEYLEELKGSNFPPLPLEGKIDLTYRCNNNCRHCWLKIPSDFSEEKSELSFPEIRKIVDEARSMGCRRWSISGGEPMLRPDFSDIFDYLTRNSKTYSINTNGTFITPTIAKLMVRIGVKMIALYGATRDVHDHITRNPGSFEAVLRGFRYLKEAGAGFVVQLIPMKDNYHQFKEMVQLAESLSKHYRIGSPWLFLSGSGDAKKNEEIKNQRLPPQEVVALDSPDVAFEEWLERENRGCYQEVSSQYHFSSCVHIRRDFHIDPYGMMSLCNFVKDPCLRYDVRKGSFKDGWDNFIPSLATKIKVTEEYKENCGSCELRKDCRTCPVYGYLEHRDCNRKVEYLCAVAKESRQFKENWKKNHCRYFTIADITIQVESDVPIQDTTFHSKFKAFEVDSPGEDTISVRHHFVLPDVEGKSLGVECYRSAPWAIYKNNGSWIYLGILPEPSDKKFHCVVTSNTEHTRTCIYHDKDETFRKGGLQVLTINPSDQILLARVLADRQACYLHSCGVDMGGKGLLFVGHSEAGKSTMATMLKGKAEILCDDRMIIRNWPQGFKMYGTWSHGDVPDISAGSAPLKAILFLEKADENKLVGIHDKKDITKRLLSCVIKPFVTTDWWEKTLVVIEKLVDQAPCYVLKFDKSGHVAKLLKEL